MNSILQHLRNLLSSGNAEGVTDGQLLECFTLQQDEVAFDALVRRHGPMVLAVCRRVLGDAHDAEDAFQATFLILIRKASSISRPERLGNWLYGVAYRTALDARANRARRQTRERQVAEMPAAESTDDSQWQDLRPILDEELNRLPEKYRAPLVCCYLQGKTKEETARQLGWPEGTVSGNLARAKEMVRTRLARRGLALTSAVLTVMLSQNAASAAVPAKLLDTTLRVGMLFAAGQSAVTGTLSTQVTALADRVLRGMFVMRIKFAAAILLTVGLIATGGVLAHHTLLKDRNPKADGPERTQAWVEDRVQAWQPTPAERRFDEIAWSRGILDAQRIAREHGRPIFMFVYDGSVASARCSGIASTIRGGPLSHPKVIDLLNRYFVPVHVPVQEYSGEAFPHLGPVREGSATLEEKQAFKRIYEEAQLAKLNLRGTPIYILSPEGHPVDVLRTSPAEKVVGVLGFLEQLIGKRELSEGKPLLPAGSQFTAPASDPAGLVLHVTARYLKQAGDQEVPFAPEDRGLGVTGDSWRALPAEDHVVYSPAEVGRLLPGEAIRIGMAWDIDPALSAKLLTHFYPQTQNTDVARNVLVKQHLKARVVSVQGDGARAWITGTLEMNHFFARDVDDNVVQATLVGFMDFEPAGKRIKSLRLVTDQATYGGGHKEKGQTTYDPPVAFGVAVRSIP